MKEPLNERLMEVLTPVPYKCGLCGKPRLKDALTCNECDQRLFEQYIMERDLELEHQCYGCGKWITGDDLFCGDKCFNEYIDRQYEVKKQQELKKKEDERCKTLKLIG